MRKKIVAMRQNRLLVASMGGLLFLVGACGARSSGAEHPASEGKRARLLPNCPPDEFEIEFSPTSEGASFRAVVLLTVGEDGRPTNACYRLVEGPSELEDRAMAGFERWQFDRAFARQPRQREIVWRKKAPD